VKADRGLAIERMVELGGVSRSGFYRFDRGGPPRQNSDMELRDAIHRIALEWPSYGRPRITPELRRQGWTVNHKRVRRLLREDNLLCLRKRRFVVTTDSNHGRKVYPNLAGKMSLTGVDQLWVADITYVRLQEEFIFLAVILDAYSRRVIGWALDRTMEDDLTLAALQMALASRSRVLGSNGTENSLKLPATSGRSSRGQIGTSMRSAPINDGNYSRYGRTVLVALRTLG
jgi:transposase InsO family protein